MLTCVCTVKIRSPEKKKINGDTTFKRNMGKTIYTKCINVDIRMYS